MFLWVKRMVVLRLMLLGDVSFGDNGRVGGFRSLFGGVGDNGVFIS